jgi:hypothetical protein
MAIMTETELGQMQSAGMEADAPAVADAPSVSLPGAETDLSVNEAAGVGGDQGGLSEGLGKLTEGMGAGDISGAGPWHGGAGGGRPASSGPRRGDAVRIHRGCVGLDGCRCWVGSMKRIDLLKGELGKSVEALLENAFFFVAMFSTDAKPLGGRLEWVTGVRSGKQWARRTVPLMMAEGSTEPVNAFRMVFSLRPRPDAIYFMTDGEFNEEYVGAIARANAEWRIPIHCITLVSREGEKAMKKIAADSGGTYTHFAGPGG